MLLTSKKEGVVLGETQNLDALKQQLKDVITNGVMIDSPIVKDLQNKISLLERKIL